MKMWTGVDPGNNQVIHVDKNPSNDCIRNLHLVSHRKAAQHAHRKVAA